MTTITQQDLDYRDLRIGRLTLNLEATLMQREQALLIVRERDTTIKERAIEIEQLSARIAELEEIVASVADDADDELDDESDDEEQDDELDNVV